MALQKVVTQHLLVTGLTLDCGMVQSVVRTITDTTPGVYRELCCVS